MPNLLILPRGFFSILPPLDFVFPKMKNSHRGSYLSFKKIIYGVVT